MQDATLPSPGFTPSTPDLRKSKRQLSLSEIQENIVRCINAGVKGLEELLMANTVSIEVLKNTTEFLSNEVKNDVKNVKKKDVKLIHEIRDAHGKKWSETDSSLYEIEPYKEDGICDNMVWESRQVKT